MWTKAHRARHEARLREMVTVSAVGEVARWLERADPLRWIVAALAWQQTEFPIRPESYQGPGQ